MNKIIAVVGMCGAGKSVACEYLESIGYQKVYFGGVTMDKLKEANLEDTPENEKMMREKLREEYGMAAFAIVLLPKIRELANKGDVVLDGLYSWDELKVLQHEFQGEIKVLAITADKDLRYQRLSVRQPRTLTNEQAKDRDISEIENIAKAGPIAYADYYVLNNGTVDDFHNRLKEILKNLGE